MNVEIRNPDDSKAFDFTGVPRDYRITGASEAGDRVPAVVADLGAHPAVRKHGNGMSSDDLASFTECLASFAQSRIKGTGADQYAQDGRQQFEDMTIEELQEYLLEEVADIFAYGAMIAIKALQ